MAYHALKFQWLENPYRDVGLVFCASQRVFIKLSALWLLKFCWKACESNRESFMCDERIFLVWELLDYKRNSAIKILRLLNASRWNALISLTTNTWGKNTFFFAVWSSLLDLMSERCESKCCELMEVKWFLIGSRLQFREVPFNQS